MAVYADTRDGKPTGRWRVEVQVDGKRWRKRFDSLKEAREAEVLAKVKPELFEAQSTKRIDTRGKPTTLEALMRKSWGSLWRDAATKDQSYRRLELLIEALGNPKLTDVTTVALDELVETWRDEGKAGGTINRSLSALSALLKWGEDRGYVERSPKLPWVDEGQHRLRWITPEEEATLLDLVGNTQGRPDIADLIYVAIRTGMRRSELLGVTERDLEPSWVRLWKTKTRKARSVPIDSVTHEKLKGLLMNDPVSVHDLRYHWDKAKEAMGLSEDREFVFHACRHTCATRLIQANVNLRVVQEFMGHQRIETTVRYAQVNSTMLQDAIGSLR